MKFANGDVDVTMASVVSHLIDVIKDTGVLIISLSDQGGSSESSTSAASATPPSDVFDLPRIDQYAHPSKDPHFYEKAFPHLFPFGGGGFGRDHAINENFMFELIIKRGADRRFQQDARFYFAAVTYKLRKNAGGVSITASKYADNALFSSFITDKSIAATSAAASASLPAPSASASASLFSSSSSLPAASSASASTSTFSTSPPSQAASGVRFGNIFSEISECTTAAALLETLEKSEASGVGRLLQRLEAYSLSLPGTPLYIAHQRKLLYSMMSSPDVAVDGPDPITPESLSSSTSSPSSSSPSSSSASAACDHSSDEHKGKRGEIGTDAPISASTSLPKPRMLTIFGTQSPCDRFNPELFDIVRPISKKPDETDADWLKRQTTERNKMTKSERSAILRQYPALAARIANARFETLFDYIYQGEAEPFGHVSDYWYRVEFQMRGTPHMHFLLWIEGELQRTDMPRYFEAKKKKDRKDHTPQDKAIIQKVEQYLINKCSSRLVDDDNEKDCKLLKQHKDALAAGKADATFSVEGVDVEEAKAAIKAFQTQLPEKGEFDLNHPCSKPVDPTLDYGKIEGTGTSVENPPRYQQEPTKRAYKMYLATHMHRCCPTCHK